MSAGLIGSAGLGYAKDRFTGEELNKTNPAAYAAAKAEKPSDFHFVDPVFGIDGTKLSDAQKATAAERTPEQAAIVEASIKGDRRTLVADSAIPAVMALLYLGMLLYFKSIGGYKPVHIAEDLTGGTQGPMQA